MADDYTINLNNELWATVNISDKLRGEVDEPVLEEGLGLGFKV